MSQQINWNQGDTPSKTFRTYLTTVRNRHGELEATEAWYNKDSQGKWYVNNGSKLTAADDAGVKIVAWADMPLPFEEG